MPVQEPAGAFFCWVAIDQYAPNAAQFVRGLLDQEGVLVMAGDSSARDGARFIRLSYTGEEERLYEGLTRLESFVMGTSPTVIPFPSSAQINDTEPQFRRSA